MKPVKVLRVILFTLGFWVVRSNAQTNYLSNSVQIYKMNSSAISHFKPWSNKGITWGYQRVSRKRFPKQFFRNINALEFILWNHSVWDDFPDTITCSIMNAGLAFVPSIGIPFKINNLEIFPSIGLRLRSYIWSQAHIYDISENYLYTDRGYAINRNNFLKIHDRFSIIFRHPHIKTLIFALETDGFFALLFDLSLGDEFYRKTDGSYQYYNLNLKLCFDIN